MTASVSGTTLRRISIDRSCESRQITKTTLGSVQSARKQKKGSPNSFSASPSDLSWPIWCGWMPLLRKNRFWKRFHATLPMDVEKYRILASASPRALRFSFMGAPAVSQSITAVIMTVG
jgi:hypothetical protein